LFGFGVSVDASAVAKEVKKKADLYLEDVTGLFTSTIADVEKFVSPGDYLKGKMTELTKDLFSNTGINESIRKDLIASTQLAFGVTTKEEATQELTGQLIKALSSRVIIFEGSAQSRATELTTLIADKLGIKVSLIEGITTTIQTKLTELGTEFDNKINNAIVGKVTNWTDALGKIGIKVDKAVTSVDGQVEAVRSGILKMLRHYQKKINDFTALITDENRYKLEAKFNSEVKRQNTTDLMLVYQFDLADPNANFNDLQKYYHMLMRGRADTIFDAGPVPGVKKIDSIETIESLLDKSKGLYVSLFGMELNNSSILDVNSKVVRNAAGDIVAMSDLKYREEFNFAGMLSRATFVDAFKINMAKHASVGINFDMLVSDVKLDHSELDNILDKLESFQLLPSDTREAIERDYLKMLGHKKQISTQLNFTLPFNDSQVKWLLSIGKGMSDNAIAKQCFVNAFNMEKDKVGLGLGESKALRLLEQASNIDGTMTDIMFAIDERGHKSFERACENHIKLPETAVKIRHIKKHADAFVDMIMSMREIYLYEGDNLQAQWLTDHQEIIGDSVDKWINTFADLTVLFSPKISAQTQCFVKLLIHLSGWDDKSRVALTTKAVYKDKSINYQ
jgi:ribosomal protein S9